MKTLIDLVNDNLNKCHGEFFLNQEKAEKYAELFKKGKTSGDCIGIFFINNAETIVNLINYYNGFKKIIVYDIPVVIDQLEACFANFDGKVEYLKIGKQQKMTKFNKIIMNPPYDKNLHLKILREAMKHIEKESGEIISLEPITELKNVTESTKEIPEIVPYIMDITEISEEDASKLFNITLRKKLGIWHLSSDKVNTYKYDIKAKRIFDKIKGKSWRSVCQHSNENNKVYLYMQGDNGYAKGWHLTIDQIFNMPNAAENAARLLFDSENEKNNFLKSTSLSIYKYMYKLDGNAAVPAHMPWLGDYSHPWTDEDLYEYFNLNEEEIKEIEEEMK